MRVKPLSLGLLALALVIGCSNKEEEANKAAEAAKAAEIALVAADTLEAPEDVVGYGGTAGLKDSLVQLQALASKVTQVPPLEGMPAQAFQGEYRLKSAAALDNTKPLRFVLGNPKKHPKDPSAIIVGITSKDALVAALPDTERKENDEGNAYSYKKSKSAKVPVYVNFVDGHAVFSRDKDVFKSYKGFIEQVAKTKVEGVGTAYFEMEHLTKIYAADIDSGAADFKKMFVEGQIPGGASQSQMITVLADQIVAGVKQIHTVKATLSLASDGVKLELFFKPIKDTQFDKYLAKLPGKSNPLIAKLPKDSPFFVAGHFEPALYQALIDELVKPFFIEPMFGHDPAKVAQYMGVMKDYIEGLDGDGVIASHPAEVGLALSGLFGVKDAAKVRAAFMGMNGLYTEPAMAAYYQQLGLSVSFTPEAYKVGEVPVATVTTTLNNAPLQLLPVMGALNDLMSQHFAIGEKLAVVAYGVNAKPSVEGFLAGKYEGGLDQAPYVARGLKSAAKDAFALLYVAPIDLAKRIQLNGMNPLVNMFKDIEGQAGLMMSAGVHEGRLHIVVDVPIDLAKQGMAAFERTKGSF